MPCPNGRGSLISLLRVLSALLGAALIGACAQVGAPRVESAAAAPATDGVSELRLLDRITWGANPSSAQQMKKLGAARYLEEQLHPLAASLPAAIQAQVDAMTISQQSVVQLDLDLRQRRAAMQALADPDAKAAAQKSLQQELNRIAREAAARSLLYALYSPNQVQEQMTWFWMNHFNVFQYKADIRLLIGDYENRAIRAHALGHFRDLLAATVFHPAMLIYLDNAANAAGHINENYARELMELHTLGVDGGYTQRDVQELARILTGVGINRTDNSPKVRRELQNDYRRDGLFEFNPNRHDYGDKVFLGHRIKGRGLAEVQEALDLLARQPATARTISRQLAVYFVSDNPSPELVASMARTFESSDGDIAATLGTLFRSSEFAQSLATKFKDPVHFAVSAVRLAYDDKPILNAQPIINWLNRMGEPLFGRLTPDGYPLTREAWSSPGQMTTRFEIARAIGYSSAGLFRSDDTQPAERPAFPRLANALYYESLDKTLGVATSAALGQAASPQEWNLYLLSSPEFMNR